jgi:predicted transcriptional regulator of viral defense system
VTEAARELSLPATRTQRLLAHLAERGWLVRIRRGLYSTVPLEATAPSEWKLDPWVVADKVFSPSYYIGGWSACEHWGLTEQIFRETLVLTTHHTRQRRMSVQGFVFYVKRVNEERIFGMRSVWRDQIRVQVSDPAHTVVDILEDPSIGGGIRQVADVLNAYMTEEARDDALLLASARKLGNRAVFKRLGFLLEQFAPSSSDLIEACHREISSGVSLLDPSAAATGSVSRRWNLRVNVTVTPPVSA